MLGLANASLVEQYDGLRGLIGQAGLDDAFALDTADDDVIERAMRRAGRVGDVHAQTLAQSRSLSASVATRTSSSFGRRTRSGCGACTTR